jgi:diguanylate cyclase (GGDEF)-like protein/PAS domain S-box-containing protein
MSAMGAKVMTLLAALACAIAGYWWLNRRRGTSHVRDRAIEQSPNGMLLADTRTGRVVDANPAIQQSLGYSLAELRQLSLAQIFFDPRMPDDDVLARLNQIDAAVPMHVRQTCKNGNHQEIEATGYQLEVDGRTLLALHTSDVTMKRKIETQLLEKQQHLDHLAHHDPLTGLPNRLYLAHHLPSAIEEAKRTGTMLAVLFLDLDHFKHINDSRGHATGDKLLKTVAERVLATVRKEDVVVRMGGDEFIVVLPSVKRLEAISELASRINDALSVPVVLEGHALVTTVSIGVSLYPRDGADMGELLRHSDTAMYQAKDRGRNNFQLFNPFMARKLRERVAIEACLRGALKGGLLEVHYQPIVDIVSQKVTCLEALLRWRHPQQGCILPARFIDIAEETGLIVPVGEFVLQRVVQDLSRWRANGATLVPVAVNISAVQLQRSDLHEKILSITSADDISPSMLQLELTESTLFERRGTHNGASSREAIARLRELGVRIAIDDFGTGYSSLSYLKQWRVDYLKIDHSFVRDVVTDMSDLAIVGAIIAMARHLNISVVAEGIEGWQQLEKLRQLGCALAQGYLFARPAPSDQCQRLLMGRPLRLTEDPDHGSTSGELDISGIFSSAAQR